MGWTDRRMCFPVWSGVSGSLELSSDMLRSVWIPVLKIPCEPCLCLCFPHVYSTLYTIIQIYADISLVTTDWQVILWDSIGQVSLIGVFFWGGGACCERQKIRVISSNDNISFVMLTLGANISSTQTALASTCCQTRKQAAAENIKISLLAKI